MSLSKGTGTGTSTTGAREVLDGASADRVELGGNADEHGTCSVSGTWTERWSSCAANVALVDKQSKLCGNRSGLAVKELVEGERIVRTRTLHQVAESIGSEDVAVELGAL